MTLNGVMAIILRYFADFGSFHGQLRKTGWLIINRCHKVFVLFAILHEIKAADLSEKSGSNNGHSDDDVRSLWQVFLYSMSATLSVSHPTYLT